MNEEEFNKAKNRVIIALELKREKIKIIAKDKVWEVSVNPNKTEGEDGPNEILAKAVEKINTINKRIEFLKAGWELEHEDRLAIDDLILLIAIDEASTNSQP